MKRSLTIAILAVSALAARPSWATEICGNSIDDDGNGYVDDVRGWNTPNGDDDVYSGGHGTQCAGMVGATGNNSIGVVGANWHVKLMPVNYGGVGEAEVVEAYTYPLVMRRLYNASNGTEGAFVVATSASWGPVNGDCTVWRVQLAPV